MLLPHQRHEGTFVPSSRVNCGTLLCGFAKLIATADDDVALLECSLFRVQELAVEGAEGVKIEAERRRALRAGLTTERVFGALTCGRLAAGDDPECRYHYTPPELPEEPN